MTAGSGPPGTGLPVAEVDRSELNNSRKPSDVRAGSRSFAGELMLGPTFSTGPKPVRVRRARYRSKPPTPPGRSEAKYRKSPAGLIAGAPSSDAVLRAATGLASAEPAVRSATYRS